MSSTYCHCLWDEAFIDGDGRVYACCRLKPAVLGNIYETPLGEIGDGEAVRRWRKKSLSGQLGCFTGCTIISLDRKRRGLPVPPPGISAGHFKKLVIAFGPLCNLRCVMCRDAGRRLPVLESERLLKHLDFSLIHSVEIQGGEPLAIPSARLFFDEAVRHGKKVSLFTNGTLIDDAWAQKIAAHSAFVQISLNAATPETHERINRGSSWKKVIENIARIRRARESRPEGAKIIGHMTIVRQNLDEIPALIANFRRFGLDAVSFGFDRFVPAYLFFRPDKLKKLRRQLKHIPEGESVVHRHRLRALGLV